LICEVGFFGSEVGWVWNGDRKNGLRLKDATDTYENYKRGYK
jgi:hypothetical protein